MTKPLTFRVNGTWGIEGVNLSTLPPKVYGALKKLCDLEHPLLGNQADSLRLASEEEMADILCSGCCHPCDETDVGCGPADGNCHNCWLNWLLSPAEEG